MDVLAKRADHLTPPFRLFFCCQRDRYENDHDLADAILLQCQFFALQFVFFRPVTTIAKVVLAKYKYFGPWGAVGPQDYRAPQFYVTLIQNLSIFVAFTGLLKFYHAVDRDLEWCRPFAKFLCIKGVVFMTFWQGKPPKKVSFGQIANVRLVPYRFMLPSQVWPLLFSRRSLKSVETMPKLGQSQRKTF